MQIKIDVAETAKRNMEVLLRVGADPWQTPVKREHPPGKVNGHIKISHREKLMAINFMAIKLMAI